MQYICLTIRYIAKQKRSKKQHLVAPKFTKNQNFTHSCKCLHIPTEVYIQPEKVCIVLLSLTLVSENIIKNTRGMPCGRGQTAPESHYQHLRCSPDS